jgi:hypothetical protein
MGVYPKLPRRLRKADVCLLSYIFQEAFMPNHEADIQNPNKGTDGTNPTYDKNQGNRGKQMNPIPNDANQHRGGNGGNHQQGGKKK